MDRYTLAVIIEIIGIITVIVGIAVEIKRHASRGLILITIGSALIVLGSLLFFKVF